MQRRCTLVAWCAVSYVHICQRETGTEQNVNELQLIAPVNAYILEIFY